MTKESTEHAQLKEKFHIAQLSQKGWERRKNHRRNGGKPGSQRRRKINIKPEKVEEEAVLLTNRSIVLHVFCFLLFFLVEFSLAGQQENFPRPSKRWERRKNHSKRRKEKRIALTHLCSFLVVLFIMGSGPSMEDHLINLRLTAKQLSRESLKCEKSSAANKLKCKGAMEKGNLDGARIFAETSIRDKNQSLNYLRLSSRIDAVSQRVNTAVKMKNLTKDMSGIVGNMTDVMKSMNVEKISQVMEKFEKQFEDLDIATGVMESSMQSSTVATMPETQVESLMQQVADEHGLEFQSNLIALPGNQGKIAEAAEEKKEEKKTIEIGAEAKGKKKGGDEPAGPPAPSSGPKKGGDDDMDSLEERLRKLQGM